MLEGKTTKLFKSSLWYGDVDTSDVTKVELDGVDTPALVSR